MNMRALSFGSVAAAYERYRPGYPDRLVDEVLAYAQLRAARAKVFRRIREVLPDHVTLNADITIHLGRVVSSSAAS